MKKHLVIFLVIMVGMIGLSSLAMASTLDDIKARGTIIIGTDATYPPMEYHDEAGNMIGFDIDLGNAIAELLGVKAEFIDTAWDGIFPALDSKKFDIIMSSTSITEERLKSKDMSDPYYQTSQAIAIRKDDDSIKGPEDLVGKVVAVQIGTTGDFAVSEIEGIKEIKRFDTTDKAYMEVMNKRADAVVNDYSEVSFRMTLLPDMKVAATFKEGEDIYGITMRKGETELLAAINEAIAKLKESGKYQEIHDKWFTVPGN
ncbi:MAG TPA: basic amino acid ABC transporter substrate-binding protein [Atribacter sp.]|uniref:Cystine-binding periplasmic protein n=1 Tax=Candidatus Atribacter allofermentans TaxID=1852833 RepID=A0A1V5SU26_9BACT|nr:basic amino acid ABC transporter substrate-binding protein [Atribacter sp.]MDD3713742.1 basic amino acid ABC transporter substrate-binding protein [Atribacterota bacterium]MDI9595604.1 basic amino acid ABC transporter substrate-binding protein [Atribacterota bacterium]OQA58015.1 MAG: Cystine-binding periplasmic protein precursor [Candidatus Atribacteria bacterium ADurb.Bin276]HQK82381.1 basic amino acid ABC transporter substrate-binding protein [Atribacter sp.]